MLRAALRQEETLERFAHIYACGKEEASRYTARVEKAIDRFEEWFGKGRDLYVFSAPAAPRWAAITPTTSTAVCWLPA